MEMIKKNETKSEISMIFVQLTSKFLLEWLLVLGLKECLVECETVCVKTMFILVGRQLVMLLTLMSGENLLQPSMDGLLAVLLKLKAIFFPEELCNRRLKFGQLWSTTF